MTALRLFSLLELMKRVSYLPWANSKYAIMFVLLHYYVFEFEGVIGV